MVLKRHKDRVSRDERPSPPIPQSLSIKDSSYLGMEGGCIINSTMSLKSFGVMPVAKVDMKLLLL